MKEYIKINKDTYNDLAKEYEQRTYTVQDDFYLNTMFSDLPFQKGERILEIGPGRGERLKNFCSYSLDVTAIELSEEMAKLCHIKAPAANIINKNVLNCDFEYQFNYIYMEAVIHNFPVEDAQKLLALVHKWLSDDGILICTTTIDKIDTEGYEEKEDYLKKRKRFRHHYTKESFSNLFNSNGFSIIDIKEKKEIDKIRNKTWQILYLKKTPIV